MIERLVHLLVSIISSWFTSHVHPPAPPTPITTSPPAPPTTTTTRVRAPEPTTAAAAAPAAPEPVSGEFATAEASWYGPGFYGNGTACRQTYTPQIAGVAHKTLPCGTMVTFRHAGVEVTVPVIDRGPFTRGRMWDLSAATCAALRHCFTGSIEYRIA